MREDGFKGFDENVEETDKLFLKLLSGKDSLKSNSKVTSIENCSLRNQLFFGMVLGDDIVKKSVDNHLELNKSVNGWFPETLAKVLKAKVERESSQNPFMEAMVR